MAQIFSSPSKYIQGYGELYNLPQYIRPLGKSFFVVMSERRMVDLQPILSGLERSSDCIFQYAAFQGETSFAEVERLSKQFASTGCDAVVGIGGGKCLDAAKMVSKLTDCPLIMIPTIAATDAPSSSYAVIYTEKGVFLKTCYLKRPPDLVLVDLQIIATAPVRYFIAGIGDALATYYEARTCIESYRSHDVGFPVVPSEDRYIRAKATKAAEWIAKGCRDILFEDGLRAKLAVQQHVVTKAVENVTEANCLLSSIGFESNGVASAHAVYSGFTVLAGHEKTLHGEYVAFGTIVMLIYENRPQSEIDEVMKFCMEIGLPVTFSELRLPDIGQNELKMVAQVAADPTQTSQNEPFHVEWNELMAAIITADELGKLMKNRETINNNMNGGLL